MILRPEPVNSVDWVKCSYQSPYGEIVSNWKLAEGSFAYDVHVPANSTATIHLPADSQENIKIGNRPLSQVDGVTFLRMDNERAVLAVGSGRHSFVSKYS